MALSKRSFANIEAVKDDDTRETIRILYDRIHDLESRAERGATPSLDAKGERVTSLADPTDSEDAVSLGFADNRYEPFRSKNGEFDNALVDTLIAFGLTEAEARRVLL